VIKVICPDLFFICPCEGVKRGRLGWRYFFNVKIVNAGTCEGRVDIWEETHTKPQRHKEERNRLRSEEKNWFRGTAQKTAVQ
jgi:hypothetical protein